MGALYQDGNKALATAVESLGSRVESPFPDA